MTGLIFEKSYGEILEIVLAPKMLKSVFSLVIMGFHDCNSTLNVSPLAVSSHIVV